jgi:hypothetical protein
LTSDTDAVLSLAVPLQGFEPITGWCCQIAQIVCRVELVQLASRHCLNIHKPRYSAPPVQGFRICT